MGESVRAVVHADQDLISDQETSSSLLQSRDCIRSEVRNINLHVDVHPSHIMIFFVNVCDSTFHSRCADIDLNLDGNSFNRQPSVAEADPFLAFSTEDLAGMDKEVDDILSGDSDTSDDDEAGDVAGSESEDSLTGVCRGHKRKLDTILEDEDDESQQDTPKLRFKNGEEVPSDYEIDHQSDDSGDEGEEGGDWSLMGAALEKELE